MADFVTRHISYTRPWMRGSKQFGSGALNPITVAGSPAVRRVGLFDARNFQILDATYSGTDGVWLMPTGWDASLDYFCACIEGGDYQMQAFDRAST